MKLQDIIQQQTKLILKEQKKHIVARFSKLTTEYTNMILILKKISELGSKVEGVDSKKFNSIVKSFISRDTKDIPKRYRDTMGAELGGQVILRKELEKRANFIDKVFKNSIEKGVSLSKMTWERAHTLPFPGMFSVTEKNIFEHKELKISKNIKYKKLEFGKVLSKNKYTKFSDIKKGISSDIKSIIKEHNNPKENIDDLYAVLIKYFMDFMLIRFSETQLLPKYINKDIDGTSEFGRGLKGSYKHILSKICIENFKMLDNEKIDYKEIEKTVFKNINKNYYIEVEKKSAERIEALEQRLYTKLYQGKDSNLNIEELMTLSGYYDINKAIIAEQYKYESKPSNKPKSSFGSKFSDDPKSSSDITISLKNKK